MDSILDFIYKNPYLDKEKIEELAELIIEKNQDNDDEFVKECLHTLESKLIISNYDNEIYHNIHKLRDFLIQRTQQHFTRSFSKKIEACYKGKFDGCTKIDKALIGSCISGIGVTYIESIGNSKLFVNLGNNKNNFIQRIESNFDFGEHKGISSNNIYYKNLDNSYTIYEFGIPRGSGSDVILDILVDKNLSFIELRECNNLIASCKQNDYELLVENDSLDPYILENYRRARLFEGCKINTPLDPISNYRIRIACIGKPNHKILFKKCVITSELRSKLFEVYELKTKYIISK